MDTQISALHVRRSIFVEAPPARVWQEFSSAERVMRWLNLGHTLHNIDLHPGGSVEFSVDIDGEERRFGGKVLALELGRELTFSAQWDPPIWPVPTYWTFRLTALYGGTQVELFHHGFDRLGDEAADALEGYETGWDVKHLKALRNLVEC